MKFEIPDVQDVVTRMIQVETSFGGKTKEISQWVEEHRAYIEQNKQLVASDDTSRDKHIRILRIFLPDLLIRGIRGEAGSKVYEAIGKHIRKEANLTTDTYQKALRSAGYRWGDAGVQVIEKVVRIFRDDYGWNWERYFEEAEADKETNFPKDRLLEVLYIGFKVRDLALSSFNENYAANDRHVVQVITRLGFLNYGFELSGDNDFEMGTNPANKKNYLFLHRLILRLSVLTDGEYSPSDLDRVFWHFGRSRCKTKQPRCDICPVVGICPTGRFRIGKP